MDYWGGGGGGGEGKGYVGPPLKLLGGGLVPPAPPPSLPTPMLPLCSDVWLCISLGILDRIIFYGVISLLESDFTFVAQLLP